MLFNSYLFIFGFLPLALIAFFALGRLKGGAWALSVLVVASFGFYAYWNPWNLRVLLPSILINYVIGHVLTKTKDDPSRQRRRYWLCAAGVAVNLATLGYFKYTDFLLQTAQQLTDVPVVLFDIVLPLGISFFTFEQIAYVVDAYRGKSRIYGFLEYCVFVTFFPHLIAGPIIQHDELLDQLKPQTWKFESKAFSLGLTIFVIGLFKKVVLADNVAVHVGPVYDALPQGLNPSMFAAWLATVSYSIQLYFDFSGYSDMAIGLARMLNLRLPVNFNSPYKAHNIIEFWRRWHMTLSRFLRNYLYIPLGGNRGSSFRRYLNLFLTMLLGGLWHGAGWGFVIWGGLNGLFLIVNNLFRNWRGAPKDNAPEGPWPLRIASMVATFFFIMLSRVFFRSPDFASSVVLLKSLFGFGAIELLSGARAEAKTLVLLFVLYAVCLFAPNTQQLLAEKDPVFEKVKPDGRFRLTFRPQWALTLGAMALASLLLLNKVSEFLYFQF